MTIRRMIVFGVCAVGVCALYLVPSVAGPPQQVSIPLGAEEPMPRPSASAQVRVPQSGATGAAQPVEVDPAPQPEPTQPAAIEPPAEVKPTPSSPSTTAAGRTAYDPKDAPDDDPPSAVATIAPAELTADALSLTWPAATDNTRVIGYHCLLYTSPSPRDRS